MRRIIRDIILAVSLTCLAVVPAWAEIECSTPMDDWKPIDALRAEAVKLGWTVERIRADDGCYHVKATDSAGKPIEGVFDPQSLKLLGRSDEDHEENGDNDTPKSGSSN
jgi:hypothetical protein